MLAKTELRSLTRKDKTTKIQNYVPNKDIEKYKNNICSICKREKKIKICK